MDNMNHEVVKQVVYTTPSLGITILHNFMGITLNEWVGVSSIIYCTLQSVYLLYKWISDKQEE